MWENLGQINPILFKTCGWTIFWFTLYKSSFNFIRNRKPEYNCRTVTLLHAIIITTATCFSTFFNGTNPYTVLGLPNTPLQVLLMTSSLGYFLYDFSWCLYHQTEDSVMLLHHVLSVTFLSVGLYLGVSGTELVATIFGTETTSIILNVRWFVREHNLYNGKLGITMDVLFILMFIVVRLGVGGTLIYSVLISDRSPFLIKAGGSAFYFTNILFFIQIIMFLRRKLKKWFGSSPVSNHEQTDVKDHQNGVFKTSNGSVINKEKKVL